MIQCDALSCRSEAHPLCSVRREERERRWTQNRPRFRAGGVRIEQDWQEERKANKGEDYTTMAPLSNASTNLLRHTHTLALTLKLQTASKTSSTVILKQGFHSVIDMTHTSVFSIYYQSTAYSLAASLFKYPIL